MIKQALLVYLVLVSTHGKCPTMCKCEYGTVTCSGKGMIELPHIPVETTELMIQDTGITQMINNLEPLTNLRWLHISRTPLLNLVVSKSIISLESIHIWTAVTNKSHSM